MTTVAPKTAEAVEVELPFCPTCKRIGKIPVGHFGGKESCSGPIREKHPSVRMKKRTFRLVEDGEPAR